MHLPVKILLVEDEPLWQQGVQALLSSDDRFELVGVADHYEAALQCFEACQPDIVLLDWKIKGEPDGLAVGAQLIQRGLRPEQMILISGSTPSSIPVHPFLFVPKTRLTDELLPLLQSVTID